MWLRAKDVARALGTWRKAGHENPFMGITLEQLKANYAVWLVDGESSDGAVALRPAHICPVAECSALGYLDPKRWREHMKTHKM